MENITSLNIKHLSSIISIIEEIKDVQLYETDKIKIKKSLKILLSKEIQIF